MTISTAAFLLGACDVSQNTLKADQAETAVTAETASPTGGAAESSLATDDVAYLTRLGLIRGHLRVGMELYEQGMHEHAKGHMKHPGDELYTSLVGAFERRGSPGFADELETLARLVEQGEDDAAVRRAYAALLERVSAAESRVDPDSAGSAATQGAVAVNLLREAAREYGIGVVAGRIEEVHEYQDAYGFTRVATDYLHRAEATNAPGEPLHQNAQNIERLVHLWPALVPTAPIQGDASSIAAVADELGASLPTSVSAARK
ncbi:MAG TPA: hypothetical protein VFZ51_05100 [Woeseiaceae bacterium]